MCVRVGTYFFGHDQNLTTVDDCTRFLWSIVLTSRHFGDILKDLIARRDATEADMLAIEMATFVQRNEKLRSVRIGTAVGHR